MARRLGLLALAAVVTVASGNKKEPDEPHRFPPHRRGEERPRRAPPRRVAPATLPYPACPSPPGTVHRKHLLLILDRQPGVFLQGLDVRKVSAAEVDRLAGHQQGTRKGPFGGWRILRFHPGDPCLGRVDIRPGDVLLSVNGDPLKHPADLARLWAGLRRAPRIILRLLRGGSPLVFIAKVLDKQPSQTPPRHRLR